MSENMFGTDGIRAYFGKPPLTVPLLTQLGEAIAQWALKKYGPHSSILLAHDTRLSCSVVKSALKSGMLLYPMNIHDAGTLPSPAVASLLHYSKNFNAGIIISASHNPYHDNGIKIIDSYAGKLSMHEEQLITSLFHQYQSTSDYTSLGTEFRIDAAEAYINSINQFFEPHFLQGKKIVLDCAHGATYLLAPHIFKLFGAHVTILFDKPNGLNINKQCGSTHPEALQKAVLEHRADVGFAFDGDGDRVIAVNSLGQIKNGDDMLSLLLQHPRYAATDAVVGTIMTNQGFQLHLEQLHKTLTRTSVGDKYVSDELHKQSLLLGGEPSGHIICKDYLNTGDGIFTALRVAQAMTLAHNWDMKTFTKFPQIHAAIPVAGKKNLNNPPFSAIIESSTQQLHKGRLIVRYSGTEPVLRIMVEDEDCEHAQTICSTLIKQLQYNLATENE
jgi:phosphoglucosamine mutase